MDSVQLQTRSNKIFRIINDFANLFPDEFEKCDIKKCGHCNAVGFTDASLQNFCSNCGGMGYVGFEKLYGEFVCRGCNGYGCGKCEEKGVVDWVTHARCTDTPKHKIAL